MKLFTILAAMSMKSDIIHMDDLSYSSQNFLVEKVSMSSGNKSSKKVSHWISSYHGFSHGHASVFSLC